MLHAILNDESYFFTHPDLQMATDARSADMPAAFDRWAAYRKQHGV